MHAAAAVVPPPPLLQLPVSQVANIQSVVTMATQDSALPKPPKHYSIPRQNLKWKQHWSALVGCHESTVQLRFFILFYHKNQQVKSLLMPEGCSFDLGWWSSRSLQVCECVSRTQRKNDTNIQSLEVLPAESISLHHDSYMLPPPSHTHRRASWRCWIHKNTRKLK